MVRFTSLSIPIIAFVSGMGGLAYEIIYARLISYYIGDVFYIIAVTLVAVFLGLAAGYALSRHTIRYLWLIELFLGAFALIVAFIFHTYSVSFIPAIGDLLMIPGFSALVSAVFISIPMFLVGFSVPVLTHYRAYTHDDSESFAEVYGLYALGAGLFVLLLELALLNLLGISLVLCFAGAVNMAVAVWAYRFARKIKEKEKQKPRIQWHMPLFWFGVCSTVFQFYYLEMTFKIFGPFIFNFSTVLATALIGIGIGAYIARTYAPDFLPTVRTMTLFCFIPFLFLMPAIYAWSYTFSAAESSFVIITLKTLLIVGMGLPLFILFGSTVPLAIQAYGQRTMHGVLLSNACGNALGILLAVFVLFPLFNFKITLILLFAALLVITRPAFSRCTIVAVLLIPTLLFLLWPVKELQVGHGSIKDFQVLVESVRSDFTVLKHIRGFGDETIIFTQKFGEDDVLTINHSGHVTLRFGSDMSTQRTETLIGIMPGFYSAKHDKALVVALGSGTSPSGAADVYKETKVIEINPTMIAVTEYMSDINRGFLERDDKEIVIQDGFLATLLEEDGTYDMITVSVSLPSYYAAGKMYTKEYFEIAKTKLAPGGVVSTWYDTRWEDDGVRILYKTLLSVFNTCDTLLLSPGYYSIVCGDTLQMHPVSEVPVESEYAEQLAVHVPYLKVPVPDTFFTAGPDLGIYTLNSSIIIKYSNRRRSGGRIYKGLFDDTLRIAFEQQAERVPGSCRAYNAVGFWSYFQCDSGLLK